ncbi:MAG TPA: hypothetical protein VGG24_12405 [Paraburkholderia sp.]
MEQEKKMVGRLVLVVSMIAALVGLAGCNTVAGFGQDVTDSAHTVQRAL